MISGETKVGLFVKLGGEPAGMTVAAAGTTSTAHGGAKTVVREIGTPATMALSAPWMAAQRKSTSIHISPSRLLLCWGLTKASTLIVQHMEVADNTPRRV
jgi:hypothetical protein